MKHCTDIDAWPRQLPYSNEEKFCLIWSKRPPRLDILGGLLREVRLYLYDLVTHQRFRESTIPVGMLSPNGPTELFQTLHVRKCDKMAVQVFGK